MIETKRNIIYLRLSMEDEGVDGTLKEESNSITNQRRMLRDYLAGHTELGTDFEEIVDDGYTGVNFQRPGMSKLIKLVEAGEVGTIIVKDLSRFGRNYLEAGYYIELVFPLYQVRLIAVNDFYDSANSVGSAGDIRLALNNIKNEMYSRDISEKYKSTIDTQRKNGQYTGRVPFGYLACPAKHSKIIDENAAEVVKKIFHMAADENLNTTQIAHRLNVEGFLSPSAYNAKHRGYKSKVQNFWSGNSVYRILINRFYTGSFDLYKGHSTGIRSGHYKRIPKNERSIMHNTHEAIVSEELFCEAQKAISRHSPKERRCCKKTAPRPPEPILARYLKCGCCGCKLFQTRWGDSHYECHSSRWRVDGDCDRVLCDAVELEDVVFHAIQNLVGLAEQNNQKAESVQRETEESIAQIKKALRSLKDKLTSLNLKKVELYEKFKKGQLSLEGFKEAKQECNDQEESLQGQIEAKDRVLAQLHADLEDIASDPQSEPVPAVTGDHLTPELLKSFVKKVIIPPSGEPEIVFKCKDIVQE